MSSRFNHNLALLHNIYSTFLNLELRAREDKCHAASTSDIIPSPSPWNFDEIALKLASALCPC